MNVFELHPDEVIIPTDRLREANPEEVDALCVSILRFKQFHPILLTREKVLIAGLHRTLACKEIGINVLCAWRDEVDELELREIELEENIRRLEMSWQERERAIALLHEIKQKKDPTWGQRQTQEVLGVHQRDVSEAVQITKMMELFPEIASAKNKSQALNMAKAKAKAILRVEEVKAAPEDYSEIEERLVLGDSVEVIKTLPDGMFNAVVTDPPFGIDYDARLKVGSGDSNTSYKDDAESYERILGMAPDIYRVLKPDGWLVWFLGISWYERAKTAFRNAGFTVDEIPIIWDRSDGTTVSWRADRWFGRGYDIALHCVKGEPHLALTGRSNVLRFPIPDDKELAAERPIELYEELIRRLTIPGEFVADFFAGSGSCPAAAARTGRRYWACELDPERRAYALKKIRAHTPTKTS